MELKVEDRLILSCIKLNPTSNELEQINDLIPDIQDWDYLVSTIIDRGIGPLLYKKLPLLTNHSLVPEDIQLKLKQAYYKTFSRSTILYDTFRKIAEAFNDQNIPVITLKGIYLSEWLYQDIGLRQFSDIDLLVKEEDGDKCLDILSSLGYVPNEFKVSEIVRKNTEMVHYPAMICNGALIEIHTKLHKKTELYDLNVDELWKNALQTNINSVSVLRLNSNDLLIHLCLHLDKHFCTGHVQFTCFSDITNLLDKLAEIIDWKKFTESCLLYNCENIVFKYIVLVHAYMNAPVPDSIIKKYTYLLTEKDEQLFCKYLKGYSAEKSNIPTHLVNFKHLLTFSDKVKYISGVFFPPKALMIQIYQIRHSTLIPFYYPYRYYCGLKWMINRLLGKR